MGNKQNALSDSCKALQQKLAKMSIEQEQHVLEYICLAARLACLGDCNALRQWTQVSSPFQDRFESLVIERAEQAIEQLGHTKGEDLAQAVIETQDIFCFLRREAQILSSKTRTYIEAWIDQADNVLLDEDAAHALQAFIERFPLAEEDRLLIVNNPVTQFEKVLMASQARPRPTTEAKWSPVQAREGSELAELVYLDSDHPSDRLKRVFDRQCEASILGIGTLHISRLVSDSWQVVIYIHCLDQDMIDIELIRVGRLAGKTEQVADAYRAVVELLPFEHMRRTELMDMPVIVNFASGQRLRIT